MKEILEKFSECNLFSLSHHYENYNIQKKEVTKITEDLKRFNREECYRQLSYNKDIKPSSYDKLINDVEKELSKSKKRTTQEERKYFDNGLWHIYHSFYMQKEQIQILEQLQNSKVEYKSIVEYDEKYKELIPFVKKKELAFYTHCTVGPLFETFYFELNDITKEWLLKYKSVFDFNADEPTDLQDLALYKDEELKFSSCTHERYRSDMES